MEEIAKIKVEHLSVFYRELEALKNVSLTLYKNEILAITGPTAAGKTTFLRCLNRLNDLIYYARMNGLIQVDWEDIYKETIDVAQLRRRIGMVFAMPVPLPTTVFENIAFGPKVAGRKNKKYLAEVVEASLVAAELWDEVKDRLREPALKLSGGQQQRLCIARILAMKPEVILFDEPCSGLDPISTLKIENLMQELKKSYTIILVTHNIKQAARVGERTAFFLNGELIEVGPTSDFFTNPKDKRTEDFISGRFG